MSDDEEYEYDYGSEQEMEQDGNSILDTEVEIENTFYEADDVKKDEPLQSIELLKRVIELESDLEDKKWTFKAFQQLVLLYFQFELYQQMIQSYQSMLSYLSTVTRNECTNAIHDILDKISKANDIQVLSKVFKTFNLKMIYSNSFPYRCMKSL